MIVLDDVKRRDEELSSFEGKNNKEVFDEEVGYPADISSQDKEDTNYFNELGGFPAPETDEEDEETDEENLGEFKLWGCPWKPQREDDKDW